jgi:molecular chaperone DnaK
MNSFGIDFGTTNSVLAVADAAASVQTVRLDEPPHEWAEHGFDRVLPTVIADAGGAVDFGWRAKRSAHKLEAVKRLFAQEDSVAIGSLSLKVEEAAAVFFRHIRESAAELGLTLDQAVVTIPANSRGLARYRTKVSAGLAGIEVLALVNEPTAAAIAYGRHIRDGERVLVFDWGGGTLDVTILRRMHGVFIEEASKGIQRLGGIDIDAALAASLQPRVQSGSAIDPIDLELAKVMLSERESVSIAPIGGGTITITRGELEDAIRPLVVRTKEPIDRCMADLRTPKIDHLVLVGGSSKIPAVRRFVREMLRLDPMEGVDPMTAVAEGASIAGGILREQITDFDFFVATEHALGTVVHDTDERPRFSTLIARNTALPASATDAFVPRVDNTPSVLVKVIEGDPDAAFEHEDNVILKEWHVAIEPRPVAEAGFDITFLYDVDGILNVKVVDQKTGSTMLEEQLAFGAATSKQNLVDIRRRVDAMARAQAGGSPVAAPAQPTPQAVALSEASRASVRRAKEKIYPFVDDTTRKELDDCIDALTAAGPGDEDAAREALDRTIRQHAYLLD